MKKLIFIFVIFSSLLLAQEPAQKTIDPISDLPPYITKITNFGQRADWSHDGKRLLFIEKTFGDVYEVEIESKTLRPMTHHYFHRICNAA